MTGLSKYRVLIRGGGELASASAITLQRVGFKVIMTEMPIPQAIRRTASFSDVMFNGSSKVEGFQSFKADSMTYQGILNNGKIPILTDSDALFNIIKPHFYIDGRMLKKEVNDRRNHIYYTIGLGPGFTVGKNCDAVIETMRGHNLGKVLWQGSAQQNTGIPGAIGGESKKRVIHATSTGRISWDVNFGDLVQENQVIGQVGTFEIKSQISGIVRGLISPQVNISIGMKIADIDPRGKEIDHDTISDKARNIGRGVLEAILVHLKQI